jgi:hypothetical protein
MGIVLWMEYHFEAHFIAFIRMLARTTSQVMAKVGATFVIPEIVLVLEEIDGGCETAAKGQG